MCTYMYTYMHVYVCICIFLCLYVYIYLFKDIAVIRKSLCSFGTSMSIKSPRLLVTNFNVCVYECVRYGLRVPHTTSNSWTPIGHPTIQLICATIYLEIALDANIKGSVPQDSPPLQLPITSPGFYLCF